MQRLQLISLYTICYGVFFLLTFLSRLNNSHSLSDGGGSLRNPGALAGLQIAGILWLGVVPASIIDRSFLNVITGNHLPGLLPLTVFVFLLLNTIVFAGTRATIDSDPANVNSRYWRFHTLGHMRRYFLVRILFLLAYECWFRGYLLMDCVTGMGVIPAVITNTVLYTLLHVFKSRNEFLACIPFGLLLSSICIWMGAAWPAIVLHIALTLTYEYKLSNRFFNVKNVMA